MELTRSAHVDTFCRDNLPPPSSGPSSSSTCPSCGIRSGSTARVELLDDVVAEHGPDRPCLRARRRDLDLRRAARARQPDRRTCSPSDLGVVPGNRVLLRGPEQPVAGRLLVRRAQGRRGRRDHDAAAARRRARHDRRDRPQPTVALCDHRFAADLVGRRASRACRGRATAAAEPTTSPRGRAESRTTFAAVDTAADDVALLAFTSGTHRRPEGHHALPPRRARHRRHLRPRTSCGRRRTTCSPAPRRSRSPSASAGCVVFPLRVGACDAADREGHARRSWPTLVARARRHGAASPRRPAYRAMLAAGTARALREPAPRVSAGEHLPAATWQAFHDATGRASSSTASARPRCCTSSSPPPTTTSARARPAGRCPATGATVLDDDGRARSRRRRRAGSPSGARPAAATSPTRGRRSTSQDGWNITGDTFVARRRRLLLVPGPQRRHDRLLRLQHRRPRGRGRRSTAPRRGRVRRRRPARRRRAARSSRAFVVLRDGRGRRRREGRRAAGLRQAADRAVQVPARRRVRRRAAAQRRPASCSASGCASRPTRRRAQPCGSRSSAAARAGCTSPP